MKYKINYEINNLKYSNTQYKIGIEFDDQIKYQSNLLTIEEIKKWTSIIDPPKENLHIDTINEINELIKKQKNRDNKIYEQIIDEAFNDGLNNTFIKYMKKYNLSHELINNINLAAKNIKQVELPLYVTKKFYDRVRPNILSEELFKNSFIYTKIEPWIELPTHPAYPSGHATQSMFIAEILSHLDPINRECYEKAANEIGTNREIAGLHYRSDSLAGYKLGRTIAKDLIKNNKIIM